MDLEVLGIVLDILVHVLGIDRAAAQPVDTTQRLDIEDLRRGARRLGPHAGEVGARRKMLFEQNLRDLRRHREAIGRRPDHHVDIVGLAGAEVALDHVLGLALPELHPASQRMLFQHAVLIGRRRGEHDGADMRKTQAILQRALDARHAMDRQGRLLREARRLHPAGHDRRDVRAAKVLPNDRRLRFKRSRQDMERPLQAFDFGHRETRPVGAPVQQVLVRHELALRQATPHDRSLDGLFEIGGLGGRDEAIVEAARHQREVAAKLGHLRGLQRGGSVERRRGPVDANMLLDDRTAQGRRNERQAAGKRVVRIDMVGERDVEIGEGRAQDRNLVQERILDCGGIGLEADLQGNPPRP